MKSKKKYWGFYLIGGILVLGLKIIFGNAGSERLLWILHPLALWTEMLSGVLFTYEPGVGYVNHSLRFIIAPSCAGINFLMISCLMLIYSFVHRMNTRIKGLYWTAGSILVSYVFTIFVNGIRIVLSIYLPLFLKKTGWVPLCLTPGQLHTMIGTAVYFLSLLVLYQIGDNSSGRIAGIQRKQTLFKITFPVFWYLFPVLGLPLLSRMAYKDYENFFGYELPVLLVCGAILLPICLILLSTRFFRLSVKS